MPPVPFRYVLNSLIYILVTGCRWCDLPRGKVWASKSSAHRWLKRWKEDGTLEHLQSRILAIADSQGLINWNYGAIDGSFSPGKGGGDEVAHGYKGKGILIHTLTEVNGMPLANCTTAANDRRLVVRWERQKINFDAFLSLATIHIWINKILLVG